MEFELLDLAFKYIVEAIAVIFLCYEVYKHFKAIKADSDAEHERRQGWDYAAKVIKEKEKIWDNGLADIYEEREKIVERFDTKLADLKDNIVIMQTDNDAKIQELKADVIILLKGQKACLDGLVEQGCNGPVKEACADLNEFLMGKV